MDLKDKKVMVVGTGISGTGAIDLLNKVGADCIIYDGNEKLSTEDVVKELLNVPAELKLHNMISLGYPDEEKPAYTESDVDMAKLHFNKF